MIGHYFSFIGTILDQLKEWFSIDCCILPVNKKQYSSQEGNPQDFSLLSVFLLFCSLPSAPVQVVDFRWNDEKQKTLGAGSAKATGYTKRKAKTTG